MSTQRDRTDLMVRLVNLGINLDDAQALRRISMTLQRWFELECGDSNDYCSKVLTRGRFEKSNGTFEYDDDGRPHWEVHWHKENRARYTPTPDKEKGARKRLARIMARYPTLGYYVQTDPRGCALYILPQGTTEENYNSGIAVYK